MRRIVLAAAIAGAALTLAGCGSDEAAETTTADTGMAAGADTAGMATTDAATPAGTRIDPNTATPEQLAGAEGVTPEVAQAIVAGRPYANVVALDTKLRETLSEDAAKSVLTNVFVPVNLNTASREEIQMIPGMTDRMVGEFLEYRPYEDMAEFDREIGKYVDAAEVARLRSYVTL